jgi:ABC-2 type transport system ATP-binding protein
LIFDKNKPISSGMTEFAIEISDLNKTYKGNKKSPAKEALKGVSLNVKRGSIFGLLGPNGAGKSTIINIMAGLVVKSSGSVKIWGIDIDKDLRNAKAAIGIVPQEVNYDAFFSPKHALDLMGGLYGVPKAKRRSMELLRMMGLEDKAHAYTRSLSGGMKRRLMVGKAGSCMRH